VYASFVQFARPRIVERHRWRDALVSPHELAKLEGPELHVEFIEPLARDLAAIQEATRELATSDREILFAYLSDSNSSERELARRFSVTRYELRLRLGDALGRIAIGLGETGGMSHVQRDVAVALWQEGRSIKEAAGLLGIAPSEIQEIRNGLFRMLSGAVKGSKNVAASRFSTQSTQRAVQTARKYDNDVITDVVSLARIDGSNSMSDQLMSQDDQSKAEEILSLAVLSEMKSKDLTLIRQHRDLVLNFLDSPQSEIFFARHAEVFTAEQLVEFYSVLGPEEIADPEDAAIMDALLSASEEDEEQIGRAFSQVLISNLPQDMKRFYQGVLQGAPLLDSPRREALISQTSVRFGGEAAVELTYYGLTPVTIVEATQGVANLGRRFCDQRNIKQYQSFIFATGARAIDAFSSKDVLARDIAVREVMWTCEIHEATASRLYDWLTRVAGGYAPGIFDGFHVQWMGDELWAKRTDKSVADLFTRWWRPPAPAIAA
jgi:hypothetical protein